MEINHWKLVAGGAALAGGTVFAGGAALVGVIAASIGAAEAVTDERDKRGPVVALSEPSTGP